MACPEMDEPEPSATTKQTLLQKYDIPVHHLDFSYVEKCSNGRELEKILHVLQSGEEGFYPDLTTKVEERLATIMPNSRLIRKMTPVVDRSDLDKEELTTLADDLKNWLKDINGNDEELERVRKKNPGSDIPDVRKQVTVEQTSKTVETKRIKSTDYSSWDKYDPDTEILKMDIEAKKLKDEIEENRKECVKKERTVKFKEFVTETEASYEADREREKGNEFFKAGEYKQSLVHYTNSINYKPSCNNYNNRAIARMKLSKYEDALYDCLAALMYESENIKALVRKAQCLEALKRYEEALQTAEKAVKLDPNNTVAQKLSANLNKQLNPNSQKATRMSIVEVSNNKTTKSAKENSKQRPKIWEFGNNANNTKRSILKKQQVILPIPGPSTMSEPYFVVVENKDPAIIKRQEYMLNNRPRMIYMSHIPTRANCEDDEDCLEIHIKRSDDGYRRKPLGISNQYNQQRNKVQLSDNMKSVLAEKNNRNFMQICKEDQISESNGSQKNNNCDIKEVTSKFSECNVNDPNGNNIPTTSPNDNDICNCGNNLNMELSNRHTENNLNCGDNNVNNEELTTLGENNEDVMNQRNADLNENIGGGGEPHVDQPDPSRIRTEELQTPFSFLKAWRSVGRDSTFNRHAEIFRNMNVNRLPQVIGYKLDGTMLSDIVQTLYLHFTVAHEVEKVYQILEKLTRVPRFNVVSYFLNVDDKSRVKCIFEFLEQHGRQLPADVKRLYN